MPHFDLAADIENAFSSTLSHYSEGSLDKDWLEIGKLLWLNPPFANIEPWARKCRITSPPGSGALRPMILFLTPASVGSLWFSRYIHDQAYVYFLQPRLSFDGKAPYPKDLMLTVFGRGVGYDVWKWK